MFKLFGNLPGTLRIAFYQLDLIPRTFERFSETEADVPGTCNNHFFSRFFYAAKFLHHFLDVFMGSDKEYFVIRFDDGFTRRNDCTILSVNCGNPGFN